MRELGIMDVIEGIKDTFSDIEKLESCCKFRNCAHNTEPGCVIKKVVEEGILSQE
jgi:ribosome biogenesis GTPase